MSSLENGLRILSLIHGSRPLLRVGEVARDLSIPKASVSRSMRALADAGLLERVEKDGSYAVGAKALDLAQLYLARHTLVDLARDALEQLIDRFGFTGHAGIVVGTERVLLVVRQGTYPLQHIASVAERKPALDSIIGRAIFARKRTEEVLAELGYSETNDVVRGVSRQQLVDELERIRRDGIACASELITPGISSVGAAVADPGRDELLGFCVSYPSAAVSEELRFEMISAVRNAAQEIGARMRDPFWTRSKG